MKTIRPTLLAVSPHAISRYRERTRDRRSKDHIVVLKLQTIVKDGAEYRPTPKFAVKQLLAHRLEPARYFKLHGLMVVVVDRKIVTVHDGHSDIFEIDDE